MFLCRSGPKRSSLDITYVTSRILGMYVRGEHCDISAFLSSSPPSFPPSLLLPLLLSLLLPLLSTLLHAAMSYPHDDTLHGHPIVEVRAFLDERHPSAYLIFNLSGNGYDVAKLNNQVSK